MVVDPQQADALSQEWATSPRWRGITRTCSAGDVVRLPSRPRPHQSPLPHIGHGFSFVTRIQSSLIASPRRSAS